MGTFYQLHNQQAGPPRGGARGATAQGPAPNSLQFFKMVTFESREVVIINQITVDKQNRLTGKVTL